MLPSAAIKQFGRYVVFVSYSSPEVDHQLMVTSGHVWDVVSFVFRYPFLYFQRSCPHCFLLKYGIYVVFFTFLMLNVLPSVIEAVHLLIVCLRIRCF